MENKKSIFNDELGKPSMARVIAFEVTQAGILIALATVVGIIFGDIDLQGGIMLISMAFGLITGGVTQKNISKTTEANKSIGVLNQGMQTR